MGVKSVEIADEKVLKSAETAAASKKAVKAVNDADAVQAAEVKAQPQRKSGKPLKVVKVQRTCVHDGPGIRTTIFFRGCGLKCLWCQNPETQSFEDDVKDEHFSVENILDIVSRDKKYYFSTSGGVTLSGGEPFMQDTQTLLSLLSKLKEQNIKICVETSLFAPWKNIEELIPYIDNFFVDLKVVGEDKHKELTGQSQELIHENLGKLISAGANIMLRMVMVPGLNDDEKHIKAAADYIKSLGFKKIELLRYHNMYEDKAKRMGLEIPMLDISMEQSQKSLERGIELFRAQKVEAFNIDLNYEHKPTVFTDRVLKIQNDIREAPRALCMEVSKLKTKYYRKNGFEKPVHIHRAERLSYVLGNKKLKIYDDELLVGNFTSKRVAGQVWEEHYGILDISFLPKINRQKPVRFQCSFRERWYFYLRIFPFWFKHCLIRRVSPTLKEFLPIFARSSEMVAGFNNNFAAIAHFIVNFERMLKLGTTGIIEEVKKAKAENPDNNPDFYDGVIIALEGLANFADRYSEYLKKVAKKEKDAARRDELLKLAEICAHVPRYPARTFHEAVQCMTFLQIALCIESYENAVSFGRVDQFLYPYYKKDLEEGRITYDEAKELLCLFILKMDEAILVNDGDSYLNISKNFETLSTDQALTFGGVDKDGNDATNDLTYMLIDACELQPLAVNMVARINKNSPGRYLERLAEIYINGCPMPELFSDEIYIPSILSHYDTTLEHARNYAIVGCVEPNASDDHFGNTDCANMNLTLPLLQAIKGHENDLWNFSKEEQKEKIMTKLLEHLSKKGKYLKRTLKKHRAKIAQNNIVRGLNIINPPRDMDELLERFQRRLNILAAGVLADHQKIESELRKGFTTPLASALYAGCIRRGKDVYEGGADFNSSGIQAIGVTDAADSLHAIDKLVFKDKKYTLFEIIKAIDANFEGKYQKVREDILAIPKFGDDSSQDACKWVDKVLDIYNKALASVPTPPRNGVYSAGYYALNVSDRYGKKTQALPSGRLAGVPLANSVTPHYGMETSDLLSALNSIASLNFTQYAANGTTVTFTIDSALFPGEEGINNLANIFKVFLTTGGMQFQPNILNRKILLEAYENPEKHKYLMVRVAGYCAYFNELSDELKRIIINRTCYA
jgi:pyruvate-formate lyase/pyruvate-formate lyase-activating enzyme